jgi:hypothetical protein
MNKPLILGLFLLFALTVFSQEDNKQKSNIQTYTPSKLLNNGQWDIKWFNNLYTQTKSANSGGEVIENLPRETYFTSSIDIFTGISISNRINIGLLLEVRSNAVSGRDALDVFKFDSDIQSSRSGLTSIAPVIKFNPLKDVINFTIQTAFHIPLINDESNDNGVFLDQTSYTFQNRFFYDYTFPDGDWQIFTELNTEYNFGDDSSFSNNTFVFAPGLFMSYFPSEKVTVLGFLQHQQRLGDFTQNYTALGFGGKYQLSRVLNIELLFSDFIRGTNSGLGQSFNVGLRALF